MSLGDCGDLRSLVRGNRVSNKGNPVEGLRPSVRLQDLLQHLSFLVVQMSLQQIMRDGAVMTIGIQ